MSRAAVFAGATLATTACGKKAVQPTTSTTQQQPPTSDAGVVEPPEDAGNFKLPYGAPPARRRYV